MREIKFRTWLIKEKEMKYDIRLGQELPYNINGWEQYDGDLSHITKPMYIMQYTGLKDKNGKEIYEGDIVKINHPYDITGDFKNTVGRVFWDEREGAFYHGNSSGRPPKRMWEYCEVIGNIYQDPGLLK